MEQQILLKLTITEVREPYHGVNSILNHYHIICDLYLGLGICAIGKITCDCIDFINFMDIPCDPYLVKKYQTRYSSVKKCKYRPILGKHKYWGIMYFIKRCTDEE